MLCRSSIAPVCLFGGLKSGICYIRINGIRANNVIRTIVIKLKGPVFFFFVNFDTTPHPYNYNPCNQEILLILVFQIQNGS